MKNRKSGQLGLIVIFFLGNFDANAFACEEVSKLPGAVNGYVWSYGEHCLSSDIVPLPKFDVHAGEFKGGGAPLLTIELLKKNDRENVQKSKQFIVDMQNHLMEQKIDDLKGVVAVGGVRQVKIYNGKIVTPGISAGLAIRLTNDDGDLSVAGVPTYGNPKRVSMPDYEDVKRAETLDKKSPTYKLTENIVDNVTIKSGWRGVVMGGSKNSIRNSTIEVDGHTSIYMFGPGAIIENNTIIIHGEGDAKPLDAAIKLRDAHGAIVRNNKIIFKGGWFSKASAAINLLDSTGVRIEENTVENFDSFIRVNGETEYKEQRNIMK